MHPGNAETALRHAVAYERILHRVQRAGLAEPLDRPHVAAAHLHGEQEAARDRLAVEVDGARAAVTGAAPFLRPRQTHPLAKRVEQGVPGLDEHLGRLVVHRAIQNLLGQVVFSLPA